MVKFDLGHIWFTYNENFDFSINYPPFYRRPYAMISLTVGNTRYAFGFGNNYLPYFMVIK